MRYQVFSGCMGFAFVVLFMFSCKNTPVKKAVTASNDTLSATVAMTEEKDSTLYGVAGDFGMSTFCLITDEGDTVLVTRSSEDGTDGIIDGDAQPGDRFCMTVRDGDEVLAHAINLTQLERHTRNYKISNGRLILHPESNPDTVVIDKLDATTFVYDGKRGMAKHVNADGMKVYK